MTNNILYIIYKLTFPNGKIYIGQCNNFTVRMNRHKNDSFNKNSKEYNLKIGRAIRKYGWNNIKKEILFTTSAEFADELETKIIAEYNATDKRFGYNILKEAKTMRGFRHSNKTKNKISKSMKGKESCWKGKRRPEISGKNNPMYGKEGYWKGKKNSEQSKRMSGENHPMYGKEGYWKDKKLSKEHIQNIINGREKSINMYDLNENHIKTFESIKQASENLNIFAQNICKVLKNRRKSAGGYVWRYN